jgi:hypothetical protein
MIDAFTDNTTDDEYLLSDISIFNESVDHYQLKTPADYKSVLTDPLCQVYSMINVIDNLNELTPVPVIRNYLSPCFGLSEYCMSDVRTGDGMRCEYKVTKRTITVVNKDFNDNKRLIYDLGFNGTITMNVIYYYTQGHIMRIHTTLTCEICDEKLKFKRTFTTRAFRVNQYKLTVLAPFVSTPILSRLLSFGIIAVSLLSHNCAMLIQRTWRLYAPYRKRIHFQNKTRRTKMTFTTINKNYKSIGQMEAQLFYNYVALYFFINTSTMALVKYLKHGDQMSLVTSIRYSTVPAFFGDYTVNYVKRIGIVMPSFTKLKRKTRQKVICHVLL